MPKYMYSLPERPSFAVYGLDGQFEGSRGLQHLRDDLSERANIRSSGKVRELIIETLVIQ